jgi:hypothetical protein
MFADLEIGQESRLYFVLNAALAASLSARLAGSVGWDLTPTGGTLAGVTTVVSSGVPTGNLVLVDASRFAGQRHHHARRIAAGHAANEHGP